MSGINIITANFTNNKRATVTRKLYKGDYGQKIQVKGLDLPEFFQVHFSHDLKNGIAKKIIGQNNEIPIPDEYLLSGNTIYAWIFLHQTEQDGETRHVITIPVIDKPNVVPVQPTPVEQDTMAQVISLLNDAAEEAQAWAVGKRNGEDVSSDDETYQNNSKYYSEQAGIFKEQSESNVRHYPKIIDGYWYFWDIENNKYINSWQKAQGERDSILQTASGNIVYIPDGGANLPIEELIVNIIPEQYGSGTPIYYNIRSFKPGITQVTIETRGKNLFDQSRFPLANFPKITDPNNIYYNSYYGSLRNLGYNSTSIFHVNNGGFVGKVPIDDVVNVSFDIQNVLPRTYLRFFYADGTNSGYNHFIGQNGFYGHYSVHSDGNKKVTAVNINTLGNASSYSGIKNLQIERGTEETEYDNYVKSYSINWAETAGPIYGGYIDVIKGKLVKTHDMIQSYQGENLPGQWYSDRDVYNGNNQPTIGAQVVYELTEPVFYQLDPVDIRTILGINNIWADNGLINVKYRADQNLYIEAQLKQAKDSGQFDGRGIGSVVTNNDYTLTFTYTDGETYTTSFSIKGQDGYTPVKGIDYFTEEQINNIISSVTNDALEQLSDANIYRYRGSVERFADLPNDAKMGDVYNVAQAYDDIPSGTNWAWTGETWDPLGGIVDAADDQQLKEMLQRLHFLVINSQDSDALVGSAIVGQAQVAPQHYTIQNAPYYVITDIIEDQNQLSVTIVDEHRNTKTIYIKDGDKGDTGNGIENISLNDDYTITVEYTDGTSWISDEPLIGANADWEAAEGEPGYILNKIPLVKGSGENSVQGGNNCVASGANAFAVGEGNTVSGTNSFAIGESNFVSGDNGFASGFSNEAIGTDSLAIGSYSKAIGKNSFAGGSASALRYTISGEANATVYTYAPLFSVALLNIINNDGARISLIVNDEKASVAYQRSVKIVSVDQGAQTITVETTLSAEAIDNAEVFIYVLHIASGNSSALFGKSNVITESASMAAAFGLHNVAAAGYSLISGSGNYIKSTAPYSGCFGTGAILDAPYSFVNGSGGIYRIGMHITGDAEATVYNYTCDDGIEDTIEHFVARDMAYVSSADDTRIILIDTEEKTVTFNRPWISDASTNRLIYVITPIAALGLGSHAEGNSTLAIGQASHTNGLFTVTVGQCSNAFGLLTIAKALCQFVFGAYNIPDPIANSNTAQGRYIEIIGNGTSVLRSNARTLDWSGNEWLQGTLKIGGTSYDDAYEVATKLDIDNAALAEVNGKVASFYSPVAAPFKTFVIDIDPAQDGEGNPSSENIRAINGHIGCELYARNENLYDNTIALLNGYLTETGASKSTSSSSHKHTYKIPINGGSTYTYSVAKTYSSTRVCCWYDKNNAVIGSFTLAKSSSKVTAIAPENAVSVSLSIYKIEGQKIALCAGTNANPNAEFNNDYTYHQNISWETIAGTIYGGKLNILTGELIKTHEVIASYNGETLSGEWISDRDVYEEGTIPSTGAQVVYKLAEPIAYEIDLSTIDIPLTVGVRTIWVNTGATKIEYVNNAKLYTLLQDEIPVHDVQVNGTSVIGQDGVAEIPVASAAEAGVVKVVGSVTGIQSVQGSLWTKPASQDEIKNGTIAHNIIGPACQHESTFYGLAKAAGDTTQASSDNAVGTYTDNAKASIKAMLGVTDGIDPETITVTGTDPVITGVPNARYICGEVYSLSITPPSGGIIDVIFTSGTTVTVLTLPNTVRLPEWWEGPEAGYTYEICITDGTYAVITSWPVA